MNISLNRDNDICKFEVKFCMVCKRMHDRRMVPCGGPNNAGFCNTTMTGPGIGVGKWLIEHETA